MKIQTSKKAWKNKAYNIIFYDNSKELNIKEKCSVLFVNYSNFAKWKIRNCKILSKGNRTELQRKYNQCAIKLINKFTKENGVLGAKNVSSWIADKYNVNISYKIINELRNRKQVNLPQIKRKSKKGTNQRGNVEPDLIKNNFKTQYYYHKIGMDESYLNLIISGKKVRVLENLHTIDSIKKWYLIILL